MMDILIHLILSYNSMRCNFGGELYCGVLGRRKERGGTGEGRERREKNKKENEEKNPVLIYQKQFSLIIIS